MTRPLTRVVEVFLVAYSVAVSATMAGTVGAYFLQEGQALLSGKPADASPPPGRAGSSIP